MSATLRQVLLVAALFFVQRALSYVPGVALATHVRVPPAVSPPSAERSQDAAREAREPALPAQRRAQKKVARQEAVPAFPASAYVPAFQGMTPVWAPFEVLTEWVDYAADAETKRHRKKYSQIRQGIFGTHPNLFRMLLNLATPNSVPQYAFALMSGRDWKYIQAMATVSFRDVRSKSGAEWVPIVDIAEVVVRPTKRKKRAVKNEIIRQIMRLYVSSDRTVVITPPRGDKDYYESHGFRPLAMMPMADLPSGLTTAPPATTTALPRPKRGIGRAVSPLVPKRGIGRKGQAAKASSKGAVADPRPKLAPAANRLPLDEDDDEDDWDEETGYYWASSGDADTSADEERPASSDHVPVLDPNSTYGPSLVHDEKDPAFFLQGVTDKRSRHKMVLLMFDGAFEGTRSKHRSVAT